MSDDRDTATAVVIADLIAVLRDHGVLNDSSVEVLISRVQLSSDAAAQRGHPAIAHLLQRDAEFLAATLKGKAKRQRGKSAAR